MAVTANQIVKRQDGCLRAYPVAASTKIYQGTLVFLTAAGYADDDTATGVNGFLGIAKEYVDNSSGSAGDLSVEVYTEGDFELVGAGTYTQANVGDIVYAEDNYTIGVAISSASVPIGKVTRFVSSTKLIVEIETVGVNALPVAALTTITNTAPGTPDYTATITNSTPFGFSTSDKANSVMSVIKNLQQRVLDLEQRRF